MRNLAAVPKPGAPQAPSAGATGDNVERRIAFRHPASTVPSITGVRISPAGGEASMVNISTTGVLARCRTRLLPGTSVTVNFDGTSQLGSVKAKVVRCLVADIDSSGMSYHIGMAFNAPVHDVAETPRTEPEPAAPKLTVVPAAPTPATLTNRW
jgi:PilZ domain